MQNGTGSHLHKKILDLLDISPDSVGQAVDDGGQVLHEDGSTVRYLETIQLHIVTDSIWPHPQNQIRERYIQPGSSVVTILPCHACQFITVHLHD